MGSVGFLQQSSYAPFLWRQGTVTAGRDCEPSHAAEAERCVREMVCLLPPKVLLGGCSGAGI